MGRKDYDTATDEINIGKEGYMPEGDYFHSIYDEDSGEKAGKGSIVPATQGGIAAPSKSTKDKYYSRARKRLSKKEDGLHVPGEFFPLTVGWEDTLQYTSGLQPVTDYHDAMLYLIGENKEDLGDSLDGIIDDDLDGIIDDEKYRLELIAKQEKHQTIRYKERNRRPLRKELPLDQKYHWEFKTKPISNHNFDIYAFKIINLLKQFYEIKSNKVNRKYLEHKVKQNKTPFQPELTSYILALETVGKQQWIKKCLPYKTYEAIMEQCKKSYNKSFNSYKEKYKTEYEEGKKSMTQERYLELKYEDLKGRKVKLPEKYL